MKKRTTIVDVARLANVGVMTVSRVLNHSAPVSAKAEAKVHEAIEQLGYHPNEMARALRGIRSKSIGVIVPSLADSFFAICAHSINMVAQSYGYSMILTTSNDNTSIEFSEAQWMVQKGVEGILICPIKTNGSKFADPLFTRTPIVSFDRPLSLPSVSSVLVENQAGARCGTTHLIEVHGREKIHFIGNSRKLYTMKARYEGYRRTMQDHQLLAQSSLDCASEEAVFEAARNVLSRRDPPTAFFCGNNQVSRNLIRSLARLGVEIPQQVAVVGFDDLDLADMLRPGLTVIRQPVESLGTAAAHVLFDRLNMPAEAWPECGSRKTLKVEFVVRSSCGCN